MTESIRTASEIQSWLITQLAGLLQVAPEDIDPQATFDSLGLASRDVVTLSGDLEEWLGRRVSPTIAYEYPSIARLAQHLSRDGASQRAPSTATTSARPAGSTSQTQLPPESTSRPGNSGLADLAEMSDEEAEALLLATLAQLEE